MPHISYGLLIAFLLTPSVHDAAEKTTDPLERETHDSKRVYTDVSKADADFTFVGEYTGYEWPTGSSRSSRPISLQVNATGAGSFVATRMIGGTPDNPGTSRQPQALTGRRGGDRVELRPVGETASRLRYVLDDEGRFAYVVNRRNIIVGKLTRSKRTSRTLGQRPPAGAVVLFDGSPNGRFDNARVTKSGLLKAGTQTADLWDNFQLHLEFRLPYKPEASGQARGNSGVYIQSRYELQVLDSFGWIPAFNDCSALYRTKRPDVNATLPPLSWQTYDIDFQAPTFSPDGARQSPARLTVWLNGVKTHDQVAVPNKTGRGQPEAPFPLPTKLQAHSNPVVFRNVWLLPESSRRADFGPGEPNRHVEPMPVVPPTVQQALVLPE